MLESGELRSTVLVGREFRHLESEVPCMLGMRSTWEPDGTDGLDRVAGIVSVNPYSLRDCTYMCLTDKFGPSN